MKKFIISVYFICPYVRFFYILFLSLRLLYIKLFRYIIIIKKLLKLTQLFLAECFTKLANSVAI